MIFYEFVTLLSIFHKPRRMNSYMRCAKKIMIITPRVINDPTEIEHFIQTNV